jgi:hypothetical protein
MTSSDEMLYSPTKDQYGGRSRRGSEASLWTNRTFSASSRKSTTTFKGKKAISQSETNLATIAQNDRIVSRRNTYVIDKVEDDDKTIREEDLLSSTLHTGGIKALLDKANKGQHFVFPSEIRDYISSHFRWLKNIRKSLNCQFPKLIKINKLEFNYFTPSLHFQDDTGRKSQA